MIISKTIKLNADLKGTTDEQIEKGTWILKHNLLDQIISEVKSHIKFDYKDLNDAKQDEEGNYLLTASIEIK